jgi:hypothetical protein
MIIGTDVSHISLLSQPCYVSSALEVDCLSLQLHNALLLVQGIVCFPYLYAISHGLEDWRSEHSGARVLPFVPTLNPVVEHCSFLLADAWSGFFVGGIHPWREARHSSHSKVWTRWSFIFASLHNFVVQFLGAGPSFLYLVAP